MPSYHQVLVSREVGGAAMIGLQVGRYLREQGRPSHVWLPGTGSAWDDATRLGLTCHAFDSPAASSRSRVRSGVANWRMGRELRRCGRGIVHVHDPLQYGVLRWALKLAGYFRVVHVHLDQGVDGYRWAFREPPELIITCARFLADVVRQSLPEDELPRTRIVAVPNAVDVEKFCPGPRVEAKQKVAALPDRPLALMLANLAPHKGQETAIQAVAILKQRGVDIDCWLAGAERGGEGACTARLNGLIREAGVADRVRLIGQRRDTHDLLRAADFFLLPSTCEGLPLSILEAQASKVPVLAAPTAGVPEVVRDGETGFLIAAADVEGYASRMELLLSQPALRDRMTEAAFVQTVHEHNWSVYCARIESLYDELLPAGRAASGRPTALRPRRVLVP